MTEVWRPVPEFPSYEVSDRGRVRSIPRTVTDTIGRTRHLPGVVLKPRKKEKGGHLHVLLHRDGRGYNRDVHVLVMLAFVGPRPPGLQVRHLDGNPDHNALANLRYGTATENALDSLAHGTHYERSKTTCKRKHLLQAPNLVRAGSELGHRRCLACRRADGEYHKARTRKGILIDRDAAAARHYALIMGTA